MKKFKRASFVALAVAGILALAASCSNSLSESYENNVEYGSLTIGANQSRSLNVADIASAVVTVTGNGISTPVSATCSDITSGEGSVTVYNVPTGNNRIVTVKGLNSSGEQIEDAVLRAVVNIEKGDNKLDKITWTTSRKGYIYNALFEGGVNVSELSDAEMASIDEATPDCDATNINLELFVAHFKSGHENLKSKENYIKNGTDELLRVVVAQTESSTETAPKFSATAYFSVSSEKDVTDSATWNSTNTAAATVSKGVVTLVAAGETVVSASYTYAGETRTGAKQTITVSSSGGSIDKLYLVPGVWETGGAWYAAYFFTGSTNEFVKMTASGDKYVCDKPAASQTSVIFIRMNKEKTALSWDSKWNQSADLTIPSDKDTYSITGWGSEKSEGSWLSDLTGTYGGGTLTATIESEPEPSKPTVTITPASGTVSTSGTITIEYNENNATVTAATVTISGAVSKSYNLSNFTAGKLTLSVKDDLGITEENKSIAVNASATNSVGTGDATPAELTTTAQVVVADTFTWDNANVYFVIQDRFYDGDSSNNNSYGRMTTDDLGSKIGTFHGGDIKGLTQKLDYLNDLGINAIWITAPYEQAHGWTGGGSSGDFAHYAYHGYYPLDYTMIDKNMGTVEEFRTFVTECHKRGIRVVMDVVMNHTGYSTLQDMQDFKFYPFSNSTPWSGYSTSATRDLGFTISVSPGGRYYHGHNDLMDSNSSEWANKWWGINWVRSGYSGYTNGGGDDLTKCLDYLPDVKTELTTACDIPPMLNTKWNTNGEATSSDMAAWRIPAADGLRQNLSVAPAVYIEKWLTAWVEEFGIDGFRCDTAKHVDKYRWGELKSLCKTALNTWRTSSRADEYAKDWDEDFWMTGESFGWSYGGDSSWFSNGFDTMIDFSVASGTGMGTFSKDLPAWDKRTGDRRGLLYISSHDTGLFRGSDQKAVGTQFVLMPGPIQIYYGDETSRAFGDTGSDENQGTRSDFDWNAATGDCAKHWGKVGTFRKFNPAVGAGSISGDTRTYGDNKVVISTSSTTVSVPYENGTTVYNWYDGKTAKVTSGSATFSGSSASLSAPVLCSDRNPDDYGVKF